MSSSWTALHAQLVRSVSRRSALDDFYHLVKLAPVLPLHREPHAVIGWFHDRTTASDAKNTALRQLVAIAQSDGRGAEFAVEVIPLALWPGLTTTRTRLWRFFAPELSLLDTELIGGLSASIGTLDLDKVNKIAATLLRNLERDLKRRRMVDAKTIPQAPEDLVDLSVDEETEDDARLFSNIVRALGDDGAVLAAVHIGGWSQRDVASALCISYEAARKRYQRATKKLQSDCPTDHPETAFPR